ncbi:hypothetical protein [Gynuella sunshinyii]|uniref:Exonuclease domain-containing protein n=1 Tax=Gynuella sunshinyii YC6258 TaxID=1445510 RepID=A0A0C5V708_9GAMM|nr:hypothetical protein [Gynuella sunshinyii]AJQ95200.1 hypothetical Protein YC6258_03164 [Gynuella sunshinyii YC6258]
MTCVLIREVDGSDYMVPIILDIEASGFGKGSYPIELGIALADRTVKNYLIRPLEAWLHWDKQAEGVHGITRELLDREGREIKEICLEMNELLEGMMVYSDGWGFDSSWLSLLFYCAGMKMTFRLETLTRILSEPQMHIWDRTRQAVLQEWGVELHRAPIDARVLQETYIRTLEAVS